MKKSAAILFFYALTHLISAQPVGQDAQYNLNSVGGAANNFRSFDNRYTGVIGSPFLLSYWQTGEMVFKNDKKLGNIPLKYDNYRKELMVKRPQGDSVFVNMAGVKEFMLGNSKFSRLAFGNEEDAKLYGDVFFEMMFEGKVKWLLWHKKTLQKANFQGAYNAGKTSDELTNEKVYFIQKADKSVVKIKLTQKSVTEALSDQSAKIKWYFTQEKPDLKKPIDFLKLLKFYESL
ncbi:MAG: hypothetical protein H7Y04_03930 [Verrucomicrobia bacterium]|nr:hypothetical protein [Cytophagales bacterium]